MIEKLDKHLAHNINSCNMSQNIMVAHKAIEKINELVDVVNELQESQNTYWTDIAEIKKELQTRAENVQPDVETRPENVQQISYMAPGDITVFHGFNCSVEFDAPLPYGTRITIKSITKGGDNE